MSSHHIVREKQEPALLVLGMESFSEELFGQLLEWSPTIITTPHTAEKLDSLGIKVDWVVSNGDSEVSQSDIKRIPAGDDTLTGAAFKYLIDNHYPAVNVITDELELDDFLLYAGHINLVIFHEQQKIYAISSGFSKWKPAGEVVSLLASATDLSYSGLEQIGENRYKTMYDGFFTLQFKQQLLFITEELN